MTSSCIRKEGTAVLIRWLRGQGAEGGHGLPHGGSGARPRSQTASGTLALWPGWERTFHQGSLAHPSASATAAGLSRRDQQVLPGSPSSRGPNVLAVSLLPPVPACSHHRSSLAITPPPQQPHHHTTTASSPEPTQAFTGCMALGREPLYSLGISL